MAANDWFASFLADILAAPVERPLMVEATAQGAAFLAGLQLGIFTDFAAISAAWVPGARFEPCMDGAERDRLIKGWRDAVWPDSELALWQFRPEGIHDLNDPQKPKSKRKTRPAD